MAHDDRRARSAVRLMEAIGSNLEEPRFILRPALMRERPGDPSLRFSLTLAGHDTQVSTP